MTREVVLVTGAAMPKPDHELGALSRALDKAGVASRVEAWTSDVDWADASLVVVRSTWDYSENHARFLEWVEAVARRSEIWNPPDVLVWNSHKRYLLDLASAGVRLPATSLVDAGASSDKRSRVLADFEGEVVIKPAVSGGARGTIRAASRSTLAAEHLARLGESNDMLVQSFEASILKEGEVSLVYFGGIFSHAVRKIPAAGDFRVQSQFGGRVLRHEPSVEQLDLAARALSATPAPTAYARVDLVESPEGPALMELEVVEPELFVRIEPVAADRFAAFIASHLAR